MNKFMCLGTAQRGLQRDTNLFGSFIALFGSFITLFGNFIALFGAIMFLVGGALFWWIFDNKVVFP